MMGDPDEADGGTDIHTDEQVTIGDQTADDDTGGDDDAGDDDGE